MGSCPCHILQQKLGTPGSVASIMVQILWYSTLLTASPLTFSILGASKLNETFINKVWFPVWLKGTMRVETCKELTPQNQFK